MKTTLTAILILLASTALAIPPGIVHIFKVPNESDMKVVELCIRGQVWYAPINSFGFIPVQVLDEDGLPESCGFEEKEER